MTSLDRSRRVRELEALGLFGAAAQLRALDAEPTPVDEEAADRSAEADRAVREAEISGDWDRWHELLAAQA